MIYEWDDAKRAQNLKKHGLDFSVIAWFGWESAAIVQDTRREYREPRFVAFGYVEGRMLTVVFTARGEAIRIISIRKSNLREVKAYGKNS
jgi:hypothetical protein